MLKPLGEPPPHSEKGVGWEFENLLYFFGGYSYHTSVSRSHDYSSEDDPDRGGFWHNCLTCLDPQTNKWSRPRTIGLSPNSRAGASAARLGCKVYIFGGRSQAGRLNDLHCLDLTSMTWSVVFECTFPDPWAVPSSSLPYPR